jgi:hypothetical protein
MLLQKFGMVKKDGFLVARVLAKIKEDKAFGCLVIPCGNRQITDQMVYILIRLSRVLFIFLQKKLFSCVEEVLDLCLAIPI